MRFGVRPRGKIPAKRVTEAVFSLLRYYKDNREDGELFKDFAHRLGREPFEDVIRDYADVGPLNKGEPRQLHRLRQVGAVRHGARRGRVRDVDSKYPGC